MQITKHLTDLSKQNDVLSMQLNKAFEQSINQSKQEQQKQEKDVGLIHWSSVRRSWGLWIQVSI